MDFDEAVYLMKHVCHEDTLTNSFLQGDVHQQNRAASTWDLLRCNSTKKVVSVFSLFVANVQD